MGAFLNILPISENKKRIMGQKWHEQDWKESFASDSAMFDCMHLTMLMQKR